MGWDRVGMGGGIGVRQGWGWNRDDGGKDGVSSCHLVWDLGGEEGADSCTTALHHCKRTIANAHVRVTGDVFGAMHACADGGSRVLLPHALCCCAHTHPPTPTHS